MRLQWFGMYHDKPKVGTFMMRVKIPSGILSAEGLRTIGEISETYGRDQGELTTRQNIQLHYITLDKFPEIFEKLKASGSRRWADAATSCATSRDARSRASIPTNFST